MFIPNRRWSNLKDASNIPSNRWRIGLETGLIDGIIFTWKRGYSGDRLLINLVSRLGRLTINTWVNWKNSVHGYLKTKKLNFLLKLNGRNARIHVTYCSIDVIYFLSSIYYKIHLFISWKALKPYREIGQSLEESLWGGKLVNPLNPKIKILILICCPYSFPTEVLGRVW